MVEHWAVTVSRSGDEIVTIESNSMSGREIGAADKEAIRAAALSLLGFIGESCEAALDSRIAELEAENAGLRAKYDDVKTRHDWHQKAREEHAKEIVADMVEIATLRARVAEAEAALRGIRSFTSSPRILFAIDAYFASHPKDTPA